MLLHLWRVGQVFPNRAAHAGPVDAANLGGCQRLGVELQPVGGHFVGYETAADPFPERVGADSEDFGGWFGAYLHAGIVARAKRCVKAKYSLDVV